MRTVQRGSEPVPEAGRPSGCCHGWLQASLGAQEARWPTRWGLREWARGEDGNFSRSVQTV